MLKLMLICCVLISCAAWTGDSNPKCNCDGMRLCLEYQRASDILIAIAYLCIPIELIYFVSCSNVPFKWVLFQFIALMVLCGLTHFLNLWTYGPHTFRLSLALTVSKMLTALVSCATAITLFNLFPLLLKLKVRDLDREVGDNQETK